MKKAVCYGEVLWDILPGGKVAGGAPMNVAFHLANFGISTKMVSQVGADELGDLLLDFLRTNDFDASLIGRDEFYQTGIVQVNFDEDHSPSYDIVSPVAWDHIHTNQHIEEAVKHADLFVYGSLAARHLTSRNTLLHLLEIAPFKVFDVNLRHPFFEKWLLELLLAQADIVKMNEAELHIISRWYHQLGDEISQAKDLKARFSLDGLILTKGAKGALFFSENDVIKQKVFPVKVLDTVGSGDAFLAGFLSQYLKNVPPAECLVFGSAAGAMVAAHRGGTPKVVEGDVLDFIGR